MAAFFQTLLLVLLMQTSSDCSQEALAIQLLVAILSELNWATRYKSLEMGEVFVAVCSLVREKGFLFYCKDCANFEIRIP
jgi:hypothetical protein